ncbi:MAG: hypothetical protein AB1634_04340 [Thermodesulfobacteriota bacterium]
MECRFLKRYDTGEGGWAVSCCTARSCTYIPSLAELSRRCGSGSGCPFRPAAMARPQASPIPPTGGHTDPVAA